MKLIKKTWGKQNQENIKAIFLKFRHSRGRRTVLCLKLLTEEVWPSAASRGSLAAAPSSTTWGSPRSMNPFESSYPGLLHLHGSHSLPGTWALPHPCARYRLAGVSTVWRAKAKVINSCQMLLIFVCLLTYSLCPELFLFFSWIMWKIFQLVNVSMTLYWYSFTLFRAKFVPVLVHFHFWLWLYADDVMDSVLSPCLCLTGTSKKYLKYWSISRF